MVTPTPNWQYTQPPYGAGAGAPPALPESMKRAIALMWAGAGMSVVYSIVDGAAANSTYTVTYRGAYLAGAVLGGLVMAGLWLWMLWKVRAGRPWARILSTVFFGFACLATLTQLALGAVAIKLVVAVYFVVALLALIMLYQRDSSAFFTAAQLGRTQIGAPYPQAGYGPPGWGQPGYTQPPQPYGQSPQPEYGQPPQPQYGQPPPPPEWPQPPR